ncbi:hypothetical protein ES288_A08G299200v1 [Gossypium darwinii]|uniref:Uncharacterized protein n=1 Tax=Gossypium darwinii TaxID=34276 RepID=A0A5D2FQK2_GOSDA|nr:hypothetical protein ES288_A08G299200v1 [Gossypium darwinii]
MKLKCGLNCNRFRNPSFCAAIACPPLFHHGQWSEFGKSRPLALVSAPLES